MRSLTHMSSARRRERRAFVAAGLVLAVIGGAVRNIDTLGARSMQAQSARVGRLSIRTTPDAATVAIDGQTRGLSPLTVPELVPGPHELVVRKAGFLDNRTTVQVRADATDTINIVLTALPQTSGGPVVTK